jgi:hypothetical protein
VEESTFESLSESEFRKYLRLGKGVHNRGLHTDKSQMELAKLIFNKTKVSSDVRT